MEERFINSVMVLCEKLTARLERLEELENRLAKSEDNYKREVYTQAEVAVRTGWSKSAVRQWITDGWIDTVPGSGKCVMIPAREIKKILAEKGHGKHYGKQAS